MKVRYKVRFLRRQQLTRPAERLLRAAGVDRKSIEEVTDDAVCRQVAFRVARREAGGMAATVAVAEELLAEEANYDFVMMLLEDVQNLVSHRLETFLSPEEVAALLGPSCRVCWTTLDDFWAAVAA